MAVAGSLGLGAAVGVMVPQTGNPGEDDRAIEIEGVQGSDGTTVPPENTIESVNEGHGSIETIRGIEGIDTVMLQNLEAVLRMQQRPQEQQSQGGARAAAALLTMEPSEEEPVEEVIDGRQVHVEYDLEGS